MEVDEILKDVRSGQSEFGMPVRHHPSLNFDASHSTVHR
jgi:hypothetical protein